MPELPEVETVVRTLRPHIFERKVLFLSTRGGSCLAPQSRPLDEAAGRRVEEVFRRGKFIAVRLSGRTDGEIYDQPGELFLIVHLRMTGSLMAHDCPPDAPESWVESLCGKHTRAVGMFAGESGAASCGLVFNDARKFGRIFLGSRTELESWPSWSRLGPEPLTMGREAFAAALKGRRAIKAVLMDQTVLAGVGNIYADESLHAAGIRPDRPASEISTARRHRLHDELVRLLLLSIEECGSSIRDYQDADGNVGAFQNHFAAYGRGGQPCRRCGATLVRTVLGGRGTVYCPKCQK